MTYLLLNAPDFKFLTETNAKPFVFSIHLNVRFTAILLQQELEYYSFVLV